MNLKNFMKFDKQVGRKRKVIKDEKTADKDVITPVWLSTPRVNIISFLPKPNFAKDGLDMFYFLKER